MSGKKPKNSTGRGNPRKDRTVLYILIAVLAMILIVLLVYVASLEAGYAPPVTEPTGTGGDPTDAPTQPTQPIQTDPTDIQIQVPEDVTFDLGRGLQLSDLGSYTGIYMEDGSDELVSRVMMAVITNTSDQVLEYAEITVSGEAGEAHFSISTLPAGASAVLLEKNRMEFPGEGSFDTAVADNISFFAQELSLHEDVLKIQGLDGALNVTNISGEDISGDIIIYYKNSSSDMLYGGITYRARIEGGLAAGEIKQVMTGHYSQTGSTILFVTYTDE